MYPLLEKRSRRDPPDVRAKDDLIAVLQAEIKILRQANEMQQQELMKLKEVIAAQNTERKELKRELANERPW